MRQIAPSLSSHISRAQWPQVAEAILLGSASMPALLSSSQAAPLEGYPAAPLSSPSPLQPRKTTQYNRRDVSFEVRCLLVFFKF